LIPNILLNTLFSTILGPYFFMQYQKLNLVTSRVVLSSIVSYISNDRTKRFWIEW
jgi:hypothetical protein